MSYRNDEKLVTKGWRLLVYFTIIIIRAIPSMLYIGSKHCVLLRNR